MTDASASARPTFRTVAAVRHAMPALLYGLRLAAGVALALYVAFYLQLDDPSWAGTSAAIVAQPVLGASLRKGIFRLIGTVIGAVASVLLTAVFPQDRLGFLLAMAAWCAACSFVSTLLRNFAAYAAMLAGYTLVIIASASIPTPDQVFTIAVARASEIALGIVCGMGVMTVTDIGRSPQRLAAAMGDIVAAILGSLGEDLTHAGEPARDSRPVRRALVARVIALEPQVDQAVGESADISFRRTTLRAGVNGLFLALSAWRTIEAHLLSLGPDAARRLGKALRQALPAEATPAGTTLSGRRDRWFAAARNARDRPAATASDRLGFDRIGSVLDGLGRASNGMMLLEDAAQALPIRAGRALIVPDVLPALVNAARVFAAVGAAVLLVVATSWSEGYTFVTFVAVTTLLLSPQNEQASSAVVGFGAGTLLTALLAAVVKFALLPNQEGYGSFVLIVSLVLVPLAALATRPSIAGFMTPASMNFIPLLGPTNQIAFDTASFANSALAIIGGCIGGAVVLWAIPPVPPAARTQRLLALTLADLRATLHRPGRLSPDALRRRVFGRLVALPPTADPVDGTRLLAALTVGLQMMSVRAAAGGGGFPLEPVRAAEQALAQGALEGAVAALDVIRGDADGAGALATDRLRVLAAVREIGETLRQHADYFGADLR